MNTSRPRYSEDHWARDEKPDRALAKYLAEYDNPYSQSKAKAFKAILGKDIRGKKVLDYGGGAGYMSVYCAKQGADVVLVDVEDAAIETAKLYAMKAGVSSRLHCRRSDVFPGDLRQMRFDVIVAKDIIEHIHDDEQFLSSFSQCQTRGDTLLLSTQNSLSLNAVLGTLYYRWIKGSKRWYGWDATHLRFYTPSRINKMLADCGYTITRTYGVYLLPYGVANSEKAWARPAVCLSSWVDRCFGRVFPFNRLGWNFIVSATKR